MSGRSSFGFLDAPRAWSDLGLSHLRAVVTMSDTAKFVAASFSGVRYFMGLFFALVGTDKDIKWRLRAFQDLLLHLLTETPPNPIRPFFSSHLWVNEYRLQLNRGPHSDNAIMHHLATRVGISNFNSRMQEVPSFPYKTPLNKHYCIRTASFPV